ncbi:MAG: GNAT family N-acetyltransferase [Bacteroidetes bacterium]|nr:MAG: GNAT family N-acetyltransferase [Bacteroidota bacterium]
MGKIVKFDFDNKELHKLAMEIRVEVFVNEQKVPQEIEWEYEEDCTHFLIYRKRKAVGTARYRIVDDVIKFERFAILKVARGKGLGRDIMRYMLNDVRPLKKRIMLNSQEYAVDFYKQAGFIICGSKFMEGGIPHYPMEYEAPDILEKALGLAVCRR